MNNLKIQDTVTFELYDCIGIVLKILDGKSFEFQNQEHQILTFRPGPKIIGARVRMAPSHGYSLSPMVYQMLIGNNKAWISHSELQAALDGEELG